MQLTSLGKPFKYITVGGVPRWNGRHLPGEDSREPSTGAAPQQLNAVHITTNRTHDLNEDIVSKGSFVATNLQSTHRFLKSIALLLSGPSGNASFVFGVHILVWSYLWQISLFPACDLDPLSFQFESSYFGAQCSWKLSLEHRNL